MIQNVTESNNMIPIFVVNFGYNYEDERLHFIKEELSPWKTVQHHLEVIKHISIICMIVVSFFV